MFTNRLLAFLLLCVGVSAHAAYAPNGPFIGLGCSPSGGCMRWVPSSEASKIIYLSAGNTSVTAANFYGFHQDSGTAASYQVAGTGELTCYGYLYLSSTAGVMLVGYSDLAVTGSGTSGTPSGATCLAAATDCSSFNSSAFRVTANSTTGPSFVPHTFGIPANKHPMMKPGGTDTDVKYLQIDCYQN